MTEATIQSFLDSKVRACRGGSDKHGAIVCLKDFRMDTVNRPADAYCKGYTGARGESAARILHRVSQTCGINPQVLIVMLEKEQSLVTHTWPSRWRYDKALGQGCPDTAPCDPQFVGFFHQIYGAARQMQIYMEGRYFTWYAPGKTWNILYNPNRNCGSSPVHIVNKATSALYYYTPYQPNAAALRAGYGLGDACSAYGNRNFYNLFTDWFGPASVASFSTAAVSTSGEAKVGQVLTATVDAAPAPSSSSFQWYRDGTLIPGATAQSFFLTTADSGKQISVRVLLKRTGYEERSVESAGTIVRGVAVDRLYGENRENTAIAASRAAWPSGSGTVMLATSLDFADALSAAAAAGGASASLLLTPADGLPADVANEIKRLGPSRVVLVGGQGVISNAVEKQVAVAAPNAKIERLAGADRYATSRAAAESAGSHSEVLIATGRDYPDALSAAAVGNSRGMAVLLVDGTSGKLDAPTLETLRKLGTRSATIVGGPGVVDTRIEQQLKQAGMATSRISGADRYGTNDAVARKYFAGGALKVLFASGAGFADALPGSVLAGRWNVPLLLTGRSCVARTAADFMRERGTDSATLIGGPAALDQGVAALKRC